jgi:fumarate hydratase subunit beta
VYFGGLGGAGALLSKRITAVEMVAYEDLGTEAIRRLEVEDFPAIVINDCHGGDAYTEARLRWARGS